MPDTYTVILAPNASIMTGPGTNTIILGSGLEGATVIDPAIDDQAYLEQVVREGERRGGIRRIFITHGHPDHLGGAVALRKWLRVSIYAYSQEGTPIADMQLPDGEICPAGDDTLRVIHILGHRFDHLCFYLEKQRTLFAGDLIAGTGTVVIIPPEGDMGEYLKSLQHIQELDMSEIVPSHGPTVHEPHALITQYIEHRLQREQQILTLLQLQSQSVPHGLDIPTIVATIYHDVDPALHLLATHSVEAHLIKLAREARVRREGPDLWCLA